MDDADEVLIRYIFIFCGVFRCVPLYFTLG